VVEREKNFDVEGSGWSGDDCRRAANKMLEERLVFASGVSWWRSEKMANPGRRPNEIRAYCTDYGLFRVKSKGQREPALNAGGEKRLRPEFAIST
jgi:hypothetical protein